MKWKRSRKSKEQVNQTSVSGTSRPGMDIESIKPHGSSHSSSLEDEDEIEGEDEDEKEELEVQSESSLGSVSFIRHAGRGTGNYSSYSEEEDGGPGTRSEAFPSP